MRPGGSVGGEGRLKGLQNLLSLSLSTCTRLLNLPDCSPSAFIPSAFIPSSPLVQFNMEGLRSALLPWACRGYSALMSRLAASATARLKALLAELAAHTALLRDRPSELPQFAAYMEAAWGHLLEDGAKRRAVMFAQVWGGGRAGAERTGPSGGPSCLPRWGGAVMFAQARGGATRCGRAFIHTTGPSFQ